MKEELLHAIWKLKRFSHNRLKTTRNEKIKIVDYGHHNFNAGPDFLNATIKIGKTTWVGHVEIHIKSTDWNKHKHQFDPNYNNVILHVVYEDDGGIISESGSTIPTLALKNRIDLSLLNRYHKFLINPDWVPCVKNIHQVDELKKTIYLQRLLIERLENKSEVISQYLKMTNNDWEYVCYKLLLKYLGLKVNQGAFEQLSIAAPYKLLSKNNQTLNRCEALLFGQAGMLNSNDEYLSSLNKEYLFLKTKHKLVPMGGLEWRFARMRPSNFPSIRIAQLANIYYKNPKMFRNIIENPSIKSMLNLLSVSTSSYWDTHYVPGKTSKYSKKMLGKQTAYSIIINAFVPLLFSYGKIKMIEKLKQIALEIYTQLPSEKNVIIDNWKKLGFNAGSAAETQALIQLKMQYCDRIKCLQCQIGQDILFK